MLQMTLKEFAIKVRQNKPSMREQPYEIYVIRDEETIFYVGKSVDPEDRLLGHMGMDWHATTTPIGRFIIEQAPASGNWLFLQYTVEECIPFVHEYRATLSKELYAILSMCNPCDVDVAEEALIHLHRPHFNKAMNYNPCPLPEKYRKEPTANPYGEQLKDYYGIK